MKGKTLTYRPADAEVVDARPVEPGTMPVIVDKAAMARLHKSDIDMPGMLETALGMGKEGVESLRALVDLKNSEDARIAALAFNEAMAAVQSEMKKIIKTHTAKIEGTRSGSKFQYKWATSEGIADVLRPVALSNGLSWTWDMEYEGNKVTMVCVVAHVQGHIRRNRVGVPDTSAAGMSAQQKVGSAREHAKRYALADAFGLVFTEAEDEGEADPTPISEEQAQNLVQLIEETGANMARFLSHFGVGKLNDMRATQYNEAVRLLTQKRKESAK